MYLAAYHVMPLTFKSLAVSITTQCNAKCEMCYQSAGPKGSDILGMHTLSKNEVEKVIREAVNIKTLEKRFHLAGGEAFLKINDLFYLFGIAKDSGFINISTTTNAYWAKNLDMAKKVCKKARLKGLTSMEISWDYWHMKYISPDAINNCLKACAKYDIQSKLRILTTHSHSVAEALESLSPEAIACVHEIISCPVFPIGNATRNVDPLDIYYSSDLSGNCHGTLNLTINALGNVYPCCAGSDVTNGLTFGNIRKNSIIDIVKEMQNSRLLRALVFMGVGTFIPILEEFGVKMEKKYSNVCHICFEIFSKRERYEIVRDYFSRIESDAMNNVLAFARTHFNRKTY